MPDNVENSRFCWVDVFCLCSKSPLPPGFRDRMRKTLRTAMFSTHFTCFPISGVLRISLLQKDLAECEFQSALLFRAKHCAQRSCAHVYKVAGLCNAANTSVLASSPKA